MNSLENSMMYSVFVRNHSLEGTFKKVEEDLDRIKALGTDILWLMPIQPTGIKNRKGKDGSPYAIEDYRAIEPKMGTWEDLQSLVDQAHKRGMKVIVDVVYNHTAYDSLLWQEHPEWFYQDENGQPYSLVKDWSDIIDLNYENPELWDYQIETLKKFAQVVDGFRCDVATRVPIEFWKKAREECAQVKPDLIWLAESCHLPFTKFVRDQKRVGESDSTLYEAFDVLYDYDTFCELENFAANPDTTLKPWIEALLRQESTLPQDYIKLRYLENHDTARIGSFIKDPFLWKNWTAMLFMLKGLPLIYHGQEQKESHRPSIFDQEPIAWKQDQEAEEFIRKCADIHKSLAPHSPIDYVYDKNLLEIFRNGLVGIFLLAKEKKESLKVNVPDGTYQNLLNNQKIVIKDQMISQEDLPAIFKASSTIKIEF